MQKRLGDLLDLAPEKAKEEPWSSVPDGGIIWVRRSSDEEIPELYALTREQISGTIATYDTVYRMHKRNRDAFWSVYRASDNTRNDTKLIGYYGLLHLNQAGRERLEAGTFDGVDPDTRLMVPDSTRPDAIYVWVILVRKVARVATWLLANALGAETYGGVPIFATAGTMGGLNIIRGYGFTGAQTDAAGLGQLFRLDRPPPGRAATSSAA